MIESPSQRRLTQAWAAAPGLIAVPAANDVELVGDWSFSGTGAPTRSRNEGGKESNAGSASVEAKVGGDHLAVNKPQAAPPSRVRCHHRLHLLQFMHLLGPTRWQRCSGRATPLVF